MRFLGVILGLILGAMTGSFAAAILCAGIGGVVAHFATQKNREGAEHTDDRMNSAPPPDLATQVNELRLKVAALERRLQHAEEQLANGVVATPPPAERTPEYWEITPDVSDATVSPAHEMEKSTDLPNQAEPAIVEPVIVTEWDTATALPASDAAACVTTPVADTLISLPADNEKTPDLVAPATGAPDDSKAAQPAQSTAPATEIDISTLSYRRSESPALPAEPERPSVPFRDRLPAPIRDFIYGGNTLVKMGVLILFLGLAFLLRYTAERVTVPIELRYAGVALLGSGMLGLGWFLRRRREDYALIMQGMGVGVFYLTTLAAMKFHNLLPGNVGFGFMAAVSLLGAALAILQNAPILAIIAALEGFATPVLLSTGGNHMMALMTYLSILDVSIVLIAWFNAWRILNVIGFVGTFTLASGWANQHYTNAQYAPVQAFLILFFLLFTAVGVLFARRTLLDSKLPTEETDSLAKQAGAALVQVGRVDSALVFGTPLTAFGLQYLLSKPWEFGPAFSALALSAFYLFLARAVFSRERTGLALLAEAYAIMGVIFGTLAIPLGFEGVWTSAAWAVEGAGMYWLGVRQNRPYSRAFAYLVLLGASYKLLLSISVSTLPNVPLLQGSTIGPILLALSAFAIWWQNRKAGLDDAASREFIPARVTLWLGSLSLTLLPWQWFVPQTASAATALFSLAASFVGRRFSLKPLQTIVTFLQVLAVASFLPPLHFSNDAASSAVLAGGWHGLLAASVIAFCILLTSALNLLDARNEHSDSEMPVETHSVNGLAAAIGCSLLSLALCFMFSLQTTAALTALLAIAVYGVQRRFALTHLSVVTAYLQALALGGFLFTLHRATNPDSEVVLANGWQGALSALMIAASILITAGWTMASKRKTALAEGLPPDWTRANALAVVVGAGLLHLAMLFGISLEQAAMIWPISACAALWIALRMAHTPLAGLALALQLVSAFLYLSSGDLGAAVGNATTLSSGPAAFGHAGFWTPLIMAVVAWLSGDWIRAEAGYFFAWLKTSEVDAGQAGASKPTRWTNAWCALPGARWAPVVWGLGWWMSAWLDEIIRILEINAAAAYVASATGATVLATSLLVTALARWRAWLEMGKISVLTLPALALCGVLSVAISTTPYVPSAHLGYLLWPLALIWHLRLLRTQEQWLGDTQRRLIHVVGCWFFLLLASRECQMQFSALADPHSSWTMLGWVLVPVLVLWTLRSAALARHWPLSDYAGAYLELACTPIAIYLLLWCATSNVLSSGNASPLPYIPILNPLELGQWLVIAALLLWWRALPTASAVRLPENAIKAIAGLMGWFLLTAMVLRTCHAWADVAWTAKALFESRLSQAALSIAWAIMGMSAMLLGNRRASRTVWMAGAVLLAVVVIKLFTVELADRGGLYRIVSFIGVGLLLLVVGYFAPVPVSATVLADQGNADPKNSPDGDTP